MALRSNDDLVSSLPRFKVKRSEDFPSWFIVTCPREDCGQSFLVKGSQWTRQRHYISKTSKVLIRGRSCPYCSKVGLPARP